MRYLPIIPNQIANDEAGLVEYWKQHQIFEKSFSERPKDKPWIMYDGRLFATGMPHYGYLMAGMFKDTYPHFRTMLGQRAE